MLDEHLDAPLRTRAKHYAGVGLFFGVVLCGIAVVVVFIRSAGRTLAFSDWAMVFVYYIAAGALGGSLYGALLPLKKRKLGEPLLVFLVALLVYGTATPLMLRLDPSIPSDDWSGLLVGAVVAAAMGTGCFFLFRKLGLYR